MWVRLNTSTVSPADIRNLLLGILDSKNCVIDHPSVDKLYIGDFSRGEKNGFGSYVDRSGVKYQGAWANGKRNGIGREVNISKSQLVHTRFLRMLSCTMEIGTMIESMVPGCRP